MCVCERERERERERESDGHTDRQTDRQRVHTCLSAQAHTCLPVGLKFHTIMFGF